MVSDNWDSHIPGLINRPTNFLRALLIRARHAGDPYLEFDIITLLYHRREELAIPFLEFHPQLLSNNPYPRGLVYPVPLPSPDPYHWPAPHSDNGEGFTANRRPQEPIFYHAGNRNRHYDFTPTLNFLPPQRDRSLQDCHVQYVTDHFGNHWIIEEIESGFYHIQGTMTFSDEGAAREVMERGGGVENLLEGVMQVIPEFRRNGGVVENVQVRRDGRTREEGDAWARRGRRRYQNFVREEDEEDEGDVWARRGRRRYRNFEREEDKEENEGVFHMDRDY